MVLPQVLQVCIDSSVAQSPKSMEQNAASIKRVMASFFRQIQNVD
jgi:hypothetical protein